MSETMNMNFMAEVQTKMSANDSFRNWQRKKWRVLDEQASDWYGRDLNMSARQMSRLRNGHIPNGEFLIQLVKEYPELKKILFDEVALAKAETAKDKIKRLRFELNEALNQLEMEF